MCACEAPQSVAFWGAPDDPEVRLDRVADVIVQEKVVKVDKNEDKPSLRRPAPAVYKLVGGKYEQVSGVMKVDLPKEIQRARELGDLRENAEYKSAKERQEIVNARIAMLKRRVAEISLINLDRIPKGKAGFGSTVHLSDEDGNEVVYQLVMPEEADAEKGMISTSSPIGRAILNKEEGDEIKVVTPSGARAFELVKLITIHDEA